MGGEPYTVADQPRSAGCTHPNTLGKEERSGAEFSMPGGRTSRSMLIIVLVEANSLVTCTHSLSLRMTPHHRPRLSLWQLRYTEEGRPDALRGRDRGAESRMHTYVWGARRHQLTACDLMVVHSGHKALWP